MPKTKEEKLAAAQVWATDNRRKPAKWVDESKCE